MLEPGVTVRLVTFVPRADTCCTNVGVTVTVDGVTALDAADSGPVPTALVAVTVNV